jgi:type II secretory pathway pseudopilin PulG
MPFLAKRPAEPPAPERTPEAKRARIAPTQPATAASPPNAAGQASPSVQPANLTSPVANSSAGANPTQPLPQPGTQPNAHNLAALQPQVRQLMTQMQFVLAKRKQVEEGLKLMSTRKEALMAQGNTPALNMLESEITKRREGLQKLSQALQVLQAQARGLQRAAPQGTTPQAQQESSQPIQTNPSAPQLARAVTSPSAITTKDPQTPFNPNPATTPRQTPGVQSPIQNAQMTHMRSISTSGVPPQNTTPGPPNNAAPPPMKSTPSNASGLNVQMQKILEIDQRNRQMPPGNMAPSTSGQVMPTEAGMNNNTSVHTMNPAPQQSPQQPQLSNTGSAQSNLVWEGVLTFNGTGSDGNKKEVHTGVSASSSNAANRCVCPKRITFRLLTYYMLVMHRRGPNP